eukprot:4038299-Prymnesium_polylepis.2
MQHRRVTGHGACPPLRRVPGSAAASGGDTVRPRVCMPQVFAPARLVPHLPARDPGDAALLPVKRPRAIPAKTLLARAG